MSIARRAPAVLALLALTLHLAIAAALPGLCSAQSDQAPLPPVALKHLSLDDLFDVEVTLVSKRPEKLSETASAIQVITAEDIRRSGALDLPDALRLAANVEVARIASHAWIVSTRGFAAPFSNKLLVMIDGRSVYTPLDAGVIWDAQQVVLEDVERIEIVSGPGGTLWGANAVNGVINIVTRSAHDTKGLYVSAAGGSFAQDAGAIRLGGPLGSRASYRVYGQRFDWNSMHLPNGDDGQNLWKMTHGGFRVDWTGANSNTLMLQGDAQGGQEFNSPMGHSSLDGQHLLGHWSHGSSAGSVMDAQAYVSRTWRRDIPSTLSDQLVTYDAEVQDRRAVGSRHSVLFGAGYRLMQDYTPTSGPFVGILPVDRTMWLVNGFAQDEISVVPDRLRLTLGAKLEDQSYSGVELQPNARLAWTVSRRQTVWAAVSRAVRSPSRLDVDYFITKTPPFFVAGGPDFHSEHLVAYELGYKAQPGSRATLGIATFYNSYDDVYSVEQENPPAPFPYTIQNGVAGQSWGVEVSGALQPAATWRLRGGYTLFHKDLWSRPGHNVTENVFAGLGNDPRNQAVLQSMLDLGRHTQFDLEGRYVDALFTPAVPSYIALDARLALQFRAWEFAVVGQNLTDDAHVEMNVPQEVPRSVYGRITLRR